MKDCFKEEGLTAQATLSAPQEQDRGIASKGQSLYSQNKAQSVPKNIHFCRCVLKSQL